MRRITTTLPEDTYEQLPAQARARDVSVSQRTREAIGGTVANSSSTQRRLPFIGLVDNPNMTPSDRVDEVLAWRD